MKTPILLHIPEPCHENWDAMTPQDKGRHCESCKKIVVDFSIMSDRQVLDYFKNAAGNTCGRFHNDQLMRPLVEPQKQPSKWGYFLASFIGLIMATKTFAQQKTLPRKVVGKPNVERVTTKGECGKPVENYDRNKLVGDVLMMPEDTAKKKVIGDTILSVNKSNEVFAQVPYGQVKKTSFIGSVQMIPTKDIEKSSVLSITSALDGKIYGLETGSKINGKIVDEKNNQVYGAIIKIKGATKGVLSDVYGKFEIKDFDVNKKLTLVISGVGFETKKVEISKEYFLDFQTIVLKHSNENILDIMVVLPHPHQYSITHLSGIVLDEKNNSIAGATIKVKGMKFETATSSLGKFNFDDLRVPLTITVIISSIGYETKEISIEPRKLHEELNITLKESKEVLDEVVVQAPYGTTKGKYYTGSSTTISCKKIRPSIKDSTIKIIQKVFNKESIKMYPNPATKNSIIHISIKDAGEYALQMFDIQSKLMVARKIINNANNEITEFQLPTSAITGTYFIRIINQKTQKQITEKIIIQ